MQRHVVFALTLSVLLPTGLLAQSAQRFSLQVSPIGNVLFGELKTEQDVKFGAPENGFGGEIQLRYTPSALSVGAGFQIARHSVGEAPSSGFDDVRDVESRYTLTGFFVEPRYLVAAASNHAFYLSARLAYSSVDYSSDGTGIYCNDQFCDSSTEVPFSDTGDATGFTVNGGGGVLVRLSNRVNLDIGGTFGVQHFGDVDLTLTDAVNGERKDPPGSLGSIANAVLRVGLAIGLGG